QSGAVAVPIAGTSRPPLEPPDELPLPDPPASLQPPRQSVPGPPSLVGHAWEEVPHPPNAVAATVRRKAALKPPHTLNLRLFVTVMATLRTAPGRRIRQCRATQHCRTKKVGSSCFALLVVTLNL